MSPEALKALRKELGCTARDLGATIGVDQETVLAWERGELFPTKRYVEALLDLKRRGPSAVVRAPKKKSAPMELLTEPAFWLLVRKLLHHEELRREALRLAERYEDPSED